MSRYWLTPAYETGFDEKVTDINQLYKAAPELAKPAERVESVDEMTGVSNSQYGKCWLKTLPLEAKHDVFRKLNAIVRRKITQALHFLADYSPYRWSNAHKSSTFLEFLIFSTIGNFGFPFWSVKKIISDETCQIHTENCCGHIGRIVFSEHPSTLQHLVPRFNS